MAFCPLVVSFYTKNTPYEKEAEGLAKSCDAHGIRYCIEGVTLTDDWHANTLYKPTFLKEQLEKHDQSLLWVDCDARFRKVPIFRSGGDLVVYTNSQVSKEDWRRFRSSCFLICPTQSGKTFVNRWIYEVQKETIKHGDQEAFVNVINASGDICMRQLPLGYVYISDLDPEPEELFIHHFQASRLYQNCLNKDVPCDSEKVHFAKAMRSQGISPDQLMDLSIFNPMP